MRNKEIDRSVLELALQIVDACASDALDDVETTARKMLDDCSDDAERQEITRALTIVHAFDRFVSCLLRTVSKRSRLEVGSGDFRTEIPAPLGKHIKYPTEKQLRAFMLDCVQQFQALTRMPQYEIGRRALGDPGFISHTAAGRNISVRTFYVFMDWLDDHWPAETTGNEQWPNRHLKYPTDLHGLMLDGAREFQTLTGMPPSEIGRLAIRDPAFLGQLPWRNPHLRTFEMFMAWLDTYWPSGTDKRIPRIPRRPRRRGVRACTPNCTPNKIRACCRSERGTNSARS